MNQVMKNTDTNLWSESKDYYSPSIHVTEKGEIGINVGGIVIVRSVRDWHSLAYQEWSKESPTAVERDLNIVKNSTDTAVNRLVVWLTERALKEDSR